jgi:ADP-ribosylation factor-binding protein GGA
LITARPKLQKWISDAETDDPESLGEESSCCYHYSLFNSSLLDTFLQINDQINTVLSRYEAFKKGDYSFASNPIPQELSNNAGSSSSAGLSLIDFDDTPAAAAAPSNDLSGLFSQPIQLQQQQQPQPQVQPHQFTGFPPGAIPQPPFFAGTQIHQPPMMQPHAPIPHFHNGSPFGRPNTVSPPTQAQSATPPASIVLPGTPQPVPSQLPNYFGNGGAVGKAPAVGGGMAMGMGMGAGMGVGAGGMAMGQGYGGGMGPPLNFGGSPQPQGYQMPLMGQPQQQAHATPPQTTATTTPAAAGQQSKDPFADLAGLF